MSSRSENKGSIHYTPPEPRQGATLGSRSSLKILSLDELESLQDPSWLIEGLIPQGGLAVGFGDAAAGKTFVVLNWAACIATGSEVCGCATKMGLVVYVAAEGARSLKHRVAALKLGLDEEAAKLLEKHFFTVPEAVQVADPESLQCLLDAIGGLWAPPVLVVIDTLARCAVGADENSAKDMGLLIDGCEEIQRSTGAAVLMIHHSGKSDGSKVRGSSALICGVDTMMRVSKSRDRITIKFIKQKDAQIPDPIHLRLEPVALDVDEAGTRVTSCRVVSDHQTPPQITETSNEPAQVMDLVLDELQSGKTLNAAELMKVTGRSSSAVYRAIDELLTGGRIDKIKEGNTGRYRMSSAWKDRFPADSRRNPSGIHGNDLLGPNSIPTPPLRGREEWEWDEVPNTGEGGQA